MIEPPAPSILSVAEALEASLSHVVRLWARQHSLRLSFAMRTRLMETRSTFRLFRTADSPGRPLFYATGIYIRRHHSNSRSHRRLY